MPRKITQDDVNQIAGMIRDWPKGQSFKWDEICAASKSILGYEPTRQGLHKKPMLASAYDAKKTQLRKEADRLNKVARPQSMLDAMERIAGLQEENALLRAELEKMAEIARRFIYNASAAGLSPNKLKAPLPKKS